MTEQEVNDVMADIRMLSVEAKLFFVKDMAREDKDIVNYPVVARWIKRNSDLVKREAPSLLAPRP